MNPANYLWNNAANGRHSVRVICDEEGLSWADKNTMCAVIGGESGWMNYLPNGKPVTNQNLRKDGSLGSTDWGICQINDRYHIGANGDFPSVDYVLAHPDEMVRWMIRMFKAGHLDWWWAYKNNSYKKYL